MSHVRVYFENGIPDKEVVCKWIVDFGCFHIPEVCVQKSLDNKTLYIFCDDFTLDMVDGWKRFFLDVEATFIYCLGTQYPQSGNVFSIFCSDSENEVTLGFTREKFIDYKNFSKCKMLYSIGFHKNYVKFYAEEQPENLITIIDNRMDGEYSDMVVKKENN